LEKLPFFIIAAVSAAITYISQTTAAAAEFTGGYGAKHVILVVCHNIIFYLYKIIYPARLSSFYPFPEPLAFSQPMVLAGVAGSILLIAALFISLLWTRAPLIGWLIFFVMLLPAIGVFRFSNVIASDKYAYLPSIGLLMILAAFLNWFCGIKSRTKCAVAFLILLLLAGGESAATRRYLINWRDTVSFCKYMLQLTPKAPTVLFMLGQAYSSQGKLDESIELFKEALQYDPCDIGSYNNMGVALAQQNKMDEAIACFRKALQLWPDYYDAHHNLGKALLIKGETDEAIKYLQKAIREKADYPEAHNNLAIAFQRKGQLDKAVEHYYKALEIAPNFAVVHYNLGLVLLEQNKLDEAISHFQTALKIRPDYPAAKSSLEDAIKIKNEKK
jgi:tetratricopeptide (TPR) repeat protein